MSHTRRWIGIGAILGLAIAIVTYSNWHRVNYLIEGRPSFGSDESRPIAGSFVGKSREEIIAELGPPKHESPGHYGLPSPEFKNEQPNARTLFYQWPSGRFLASIELKGDRWICFTSHWVPKGWVLD